MRQFLQFIILSITATALSAQTTAGISRGIAAHEYSTYQAFQDTFWTSGELDTVFEAGTSRTFIVDLPPDTVSWFMEVKYGLWNSPDVPMTFIVNGDTVGTVIADRGYKIPGPCYVIWHITGNLTPGLNTIEMISQPGNGDAVLGHIYLLTDTYLGQTLTLRLAGMTPHINQLMEARLLNSSSLEEIALKTVESIPGDQFDLIFTGVEDGTGYQLDFYADLSGNGEYDAPPTDHAWRLVLQPFYGDTLVFFTPDTNFTDIGFPASLTDAQEFETPEDISLYQNYPNPFNPSTKIKFQIPNSKFTTLKVYNVLGKEVATLVSKNLNQGNHIYQFDGNNLASGVYFYQLVAGDFREVKKMILMR
jgi:hypothetical protein